MSRRKKTIRKEYKRSKTVHNSEAAAWKDVSNKTGMLREMIVDKPHTETHWVFVLERHPTRIHNCWST